MVIILASLCKALLIFREIVCTLLERLEMNGRHLPALSDPDLDCCRLRGNHHCLFDSLPPVDKEYFISVVLFTKLNGSN